MTAIVLGIVAAMVTPLLVALAYRRLRQRRAARAMAITAPPGIVAEEFVCLGGVAQWIGIRGRDRDNPLLLILHGGPGMPYAPFAPRLRSWEEHFTLVQWDRRGVGKTLGRNGKPGCGEMSFQRMVDDAIELCEELLRRFPRSRLVVLSSSMGTLVALPLVQRRPDLVCAWVATDVNIGAARNEQAGHDATVAALRARGQRRAAAELERIGPDPRRCDARGWQRKMQLIMKTEEVKPGFMGIVMPTLLLAPDYGLRDLMHVFAGLQFATAALLPELAAFDAWEHGTQLAVPFFVAQGEADVFTRVGPVVDYFRAVEAPLKRLHVIKGVGHFAAFVRPEQFMADVLREVRALA
jgi:pimeloyl-ACP methyl ester carboxylesterase